jgi:hypothetical protein
MVPLSTLQVSCLLSELTALKLREEEKKQHQAKASRSTTLQKKVVQRRKMMMRTRTIEHTA